MLIRLQINGLAIIDKMTIEFAPGFNVITGETGAGKSILIKALNILLGAKVNAEVVRQGCSQATVAGYFQVPNTHESVKILQELGIPNDNALNESKPSSTDLLLRRTITQNGRTNAWVNDTPLTLASLRHLGSTLVDIFAQHDNLRLLDDNKHTRYLDSFVRNPTPVNDVIQYYKKCWEDIRKIQKIVTSFKEQKKTQDYVQFRLQELEEFSPTVEDFHSIFAFCNSAEDQLKKRDLYTNVQARLDQGANGDSLSHILWTCARSLEKVSFASEHATLLQETQDIATRLDELSYHIGRYQSLFSLNEEEWERAQSRLAKYQNLFRKWGIESVEELLKKKQQLKNDLQFLEKARLQIEDCLASLLSHVEKLNSAAELLSSERKKAVTLLKSRVGKEFKDLALAEGKIDIDFEPSQQATPEIDLQEFGSEFLVTHAKSVDRIKNILSGVREYGKEKATFLLTTNPGEPLRQLSKVASGGEVSRIMLALKKVLATDANTCLLVFDEIDTGISGRVADMVGSKMKELATSTQVICISHLPQVAAHADKHLSVRKSGQKNKTDVKVHSLDEQASIEEIARLLSGEEITEVSLQNARSLRKAKRMPVRMLESRL